MLISELKQSHKFEQKVLGLLREKLVARFSNESVFVMGKDLLFKNIEDHETYKGVIPLRKFDSVLTVQNLGFLCFALEKHSAKGDEWKIVFEEGEDAQKEEVNVDIIIRMAVRDWLKRKGLLNNDNTMEHFITIAQSPSMFRVHHFFINGDLWFLWIWGG